MHNVASGSKSKKKSLSDRNVRAGHVRIAKGFLTMDLNRAVVAQRSCERVRTDAQAMREFDLRTRQCVHTCVTLEIPI
jgi:hypothetical protein